MQQLANQTANCSGIYVQESLRKREKTELYGMFSLYCAATELGGLQMIFYQYNNRCLWGKLRVFKCESLQLQVEKFQSGLQTCLRCISANSPLDGSLRARRIRTILLEKHKRDLLKKKAHLCRHAFHVRLKVKLSYLLHFRLLLTYESNIASASRADYCFHCWYSITSAASWTFECSSSKSSGAVSVCYDPLEDSPPKTAFGASGASVIPKITFI